jgi:4-aminobutyrate aminotransferase/(S)-3-amino-2-methylpropionate transaminase
MNLQAKNEILNEQRNRFISEGVASVTPMYVESAKGAIIKDVDGREYIDFAGGIAVMNIGHSHPKVVAASVGRKTLPADAGRFCQKGGFPELWRGSG